MSVKLVAYSNSIEGKLVYWSVGLVKHEGQPFLVEIGGFFSSKEGALITGLSIMKNRRTPRIHEITKVIEEHGGMCE